MIGKEKHSGKVVDEWNKLVKEQDTKVEVVDMSYAVSAFMAVKDEEELVSPSNRLWMCLFFDRYIPPEMDAHSCKFKFDAIDSSCRNEAGADSRQGDQNHTPGVRGPN